MAVKLELIRQVEDEEANKSHQLFFWFFYRAVVPAAIC